MLAVPLARFAGFLPPAVPRRYLTGRQPKKRNRRPLNANSQDDDQLRCQECQTPYSTTEARVQRSLKQFFGLSRAKKNTYTPRLCWVCARLYYSARQPDGLDKMWHEFTGGLAE